MLMSVNRLLLPIALIASPVSPDLHADMERALKDDGLTGAVWATVSPDGAIAIDAAGLKDARSGELLSPDDRVQIGSVAKTLLAAGIMRLVTEGRLALDTPIAELLPDLVFDNTWEAGDPIRLRHLLDHTAGLDDARFWQVFSLKPDADTPLRRAFTGDPSLLRVRSQPGSRFSYSNMGYTLLGMIVESITGERYERYLDVHLLQPLAMHDSSFAFVSQVGTQADPRLAMGHFEDGVTQAAVPMYLRPPVQFTTTAMDMARFARFLMGDGDIDGEAFIDAALLRAMGQPMGTEAAQAGLTVGYSLGLARRDRHGVMGRCHSGNTVGYRAMLCLFPEQQQAFFVAFNTDSETADYGRFDALLIRALNVAAAAPAKAGTPSEDIADWQGIYVPAPNRFASFAWLDTVLNFVRVRWDGTDLLLKPLLSDDRVLTPAGGLLFNAADRTTTSHVLLTSSDGKRVISDGLQSYEQVSLMKIAPLWVSLVAGLCGLIFIFVSGFVRLLMGRLTPSRALFVPFLAVIALLLPLQSERRRLMCETFRFPLLINVLVLALSACGETATLPVEEGMGPDPTLPPPNPTLIPTVNIAPATGWPAGAMPEAAPGLSVSAYATEFDHPRWLYVLPNGDVLVAESNAPPKPEDQKGIKGWIMKRVMKRAGSAVPSANRITLLRDADGMAETRSVFLQGLNSPFGMTLIGRDFYVANTDAVVRFPYGDGDTQITAPAGPINRHWTKNTIASRDGSRLYVTVGSNSNVGEKGMDKETNRAAILEIDPVTGRSRVFASGLRNPNELGWQPQSGALWTAVNERDELGRDLVPDYMTSVQDGGFYGWPYSYFVQHVDARVEPARPDLVEKAIVPDYALGAHTASLGLTFHEGDLLPERYQGGAFIGQHGSWNRDPLNGYKVIFVPFAGGSPAGPAEDVLTGFVNADGEALGRPVGVAVDGAGELLVADDVGNTVWRVTPAEVRRPSR